MRAGQWQLLLLMFGGQLAGPPAGNHVQKSRSLSLRFLSAVGLSHRGQTYNMQAESAKKPVPGNIMRGLHWHAGMTTWASDLQWAFPRKRPWSFLPNTTVQLLPVRPGQRDTGDSYGPTVMGAAQHMTSPAADPQKMLCTLRCRVMLEARGCRRTSDPSLALTSPAAVPQDVLCMGPAADPQDLLYMGPTADPQTLLYMGSHLEVQGHLGAAAQGLPIIVGDGERAACLGLPDVLLVVIVLGDDLQDSRKRALFMGCESLSWLHTMNWWPGGCSSLDSSSEGWTQAALCCR